MTKARMVPIDGHLLDVSNETRTAFQLGQFRQVDEDEAQHDHRIEEFLDDDGRQRSGDRHAFAPLEHHRPQHFPGARRVDVIAHVADAGDREHARAS